jgi:hypothetical protein
MESSKHVTSDSPLPRVEIVAVNGLNNHAATAKLRALGATCWIRSNESINLTGQGGGGSVRAANDHAVLPGRSSVH